ncbi:MAG: hypothetical protein AAF368_07250 [Planctomycetota bacterium]
MNGPLVWLLAQRDRWERLGDNFSGDNARIDLGEIGWLVAVGAGAVLALWWLSTLAERLEGRATFRPNPGKMFRELCGAHGLNRSQRTLLRRLAEAAELDHAATLFVREELFDSQRLPAEADALLELKQKLFAA